MLKSTSLALLHCKEILIIYVIVNVDVLPKKVVQSVQKEDHWNVMKVITDKMVSVTKSLQLILEMPFFHAKAILMIIQLYVIIKEVLYVDKKEKIGAEMSCHVS